MSQTTDTGVTDTGVRDTGVTDTGVTGTGVTDTGVTDNWCHRHWFPLSYTLNAVYGAAARELLPPRRLTTDYLLKNLDFV